MRQFNPASRTDFLPLMSQSSAERLPIVHVNASPTLGGAEVYTRFLAETLQSAGWDNCIVVAEGAEYWDSLAGAVPRITHDFRLREDIAGLPGRCLVCIHAPLPKGLVDRLALRHRVLGVGHQAVYSSAIPHYYHAAHSLLPVSAHVAKGLRIAGFTNVHPEPLLGVAALARNASAGSIHRGALVEWDRGKLRDRVLAALEPLSQKLAGQAVFERKPGLTLGIVSRLAPLKQFPQLFEAIVPVLLRHPDVNLELFGSAIGYRVLRQLRTELRPLGSRARFWGFQSDVAAVYPHLDFLLTGLPEREALGLNVIEAQQCGVPVLAPDAPPFTETMVEGETGYLYTDPRTDGGAGFEAVLLKARAFRPDPRKATAHLARFSTIAFQERVHRVFERECALALESQVAHG